MKEKEEKKKQREEKQRQKQKEKNGEFHPRKTTRPSAIRTYREAEDS